jgi:hypothetical protein
VYERHREKLHTDHCRHDLQQEIETILWFQIWLHLNEQPHDITSNNPTNASTWSQKWDVFPNTQNEKPHPIEFDLPVIELFTAMISGTQGNAICQWAANTHNQRTQQLYLSRYNCIRVLPQLWTVTAHLLGEADTTEMKPLSLAIVVVAANHLTERNL